MKIKMIRNEKGSIDGFTVKLYEAGSEVDLPEDLAEVFITIGAAEAVKENRIEPKPIETPEFKEVSIEAPESQDLMKAIVKKIPEKPQNRWRKK